jgi:alpha-beta hydrolase superfamily lysophospholipase
VSIAAPPAPAREARPAAEPAPSAEPAPTAMPEPDPSAATVARTPAAAGPRPAPRALWLELDGARVFAVFHDAAPAATREEPVLILPPWGWHDVASYRARGVWAEHLASGGHPALRIDLPGTGDSSGSPADGDQVGPWLRAIDAASRWLAATSGSDGVVAIGLGLGGLLALRAAADGAPIDRLAAWAMPGSGRDEIRRQRAFARLHPARYSLTEPEPVALPDGWLEVNGFVLSAPTLETLGGLTVPERFDRAPRQVLVLDADGVAVSGDAAARLRGSGIAVETAPGPGWEAVTFHPQQFDPPTAVWSTVDAWLGRHAERPEPAARATGPGERASGDDMTAFDVDGVRVRERAVWVPASAGRLFGILSERDDPAGTTTAAPLAALFLNAGAVRRIGPNRIWVGAARRWAALGVPTLRVDLDGIGDSDGDAGRYRDVGEFYAREEIAADLRRFADELASRTGADRLVLAGLCAGGHWAFQGADRDPRVVAAYLLNPGALVWDTHLVRRRDARRLRRLTDPAWWRRLVSGRVRPARIRAIAGATLAQAGDGLRGSLRQGRASDGAPIDRRPAAVLDRLRDRGTTVVLAFSHDEGLHDELRRDGLLARLPEWPNVREATLPGRDHTLRPIVAQNAVHELLDRSLRMDMDRLAIEPAKGTGAG